MPKRKHEPNQVKTMNEWTCWVCLDDNACVNNQLIKCDGTCKVVVHQLCYGVDKVPDGSWNCDRCAYDRRSSSLKCALCPVKEGPMKKTETEEWCHIICALFVPTVTFGNESIMCPIVISNVKKSDSRCALCTARGDYDSAKVGVCINCEEEGCEEYFHVGCAWQAEILVELEYGTPIRGEKRGRRSHNNKCLYVAYCKAHYSSALDTHAKAGVTVRRYQVQPPESDTSMMSPSSSNSSFFANPAVNVVRRPRGRPRRINPDVTITSNEDVKDVKPIKPTGARPVGRPAKRHASFNDQPKAKVRRESTGDIPNKRVSNDSSSRSKTTESASKSRTGNTANSLSRTDFPTVRPTTSSEYQSSIHHSVSSNGSSLPRRHSTVDYSQRPMQVSNATSTSASVCASVSSNTITTDTAVSIASNNNRVIVRSDEEMSMFLLELATHPQDRLFEMEYFVSKRYFERVVHYIDHADDEEEDTDGDESQCSIPQFNNSTSRCKQQYPTSLANCVRLTFVDLLDFLRKVDERKVWLVRENEKLERQLHDLEFQERLQASASSGLATVPTTQASQQPLPRALTSIGARLPADELNNNEKLAMTYNGVLHSPNGSCSARR